MQRLIKEIQNIISHLTIYVYVGSFRLVFDAKLTNCFIHSFYEFEDLEIYDYEILEKDNPVGLLDLIMIRLLQLLTLIHFQKLN